MVSPARLLIATLMLGVASAPVRAGVFNPVTFELANGMTVVVIENHRAPIVSHMVWYRVGSADSPIGKSGLAHFFEHLMFKGTPEVPAGQFSKTVARHGGRDNAFTSQDFTAYFQNVAADRLELVMKLESDRMVNLALSDEVVRPEVDVVLEERRSRTDNEPAALLHERMDAIFHLTHPYRNPVIGWEHEIRSYTRADAEAFYRRWYAPNNAILIVAGDVTADGVRPLAEKYYGRIPARALAPRQRPREVESLAARRVVLRDKAVRQPSWSRDYRAPAFGDGTPKETLYALQVLAHVLGSGATSRLYRALVVEQALAVSAGASYSPDRLDLDAFGFHATPRPGIDIARVEAAMEAEIARLLKDGVTEDEVARSKKRLVAETVYARDSLSRGSYTLGIALTTGQTVADVEAWPERIAQVNAAQVNAAAKAILSEDRSITGLLLPALADEGGKP